MKILFSVATFFILFFSCTLLNTYKEEAERYFKEKKYEKALIEINKAIELAPDSVSYYGLRILIYDVMGRYREQIIDLNKIIEINKKVNSKSVNAHKLRTVAYLNLGLYKEALLDINYFIDNRDTIDSLPEAYLTKASILYKLKDFKNAGKFYNLVIKENNGNDKFIEAQALVGLANLSKSPNDALKLLNKAISIDDSCALAYGARGTIYYELGKIDKAYIDLNKSIFLNPYNAALYFNMGQLFTNNIKNNDSAIMYFKKALQVSPQSPENDQVYMNIAVLEHQLGKLDTALTYFEKAEEINSKNDLLLYNFALLLSDMNRNDEALEKIKRAIIINSNDPEYFDTKGTILFSLSLFKDSEKEYFKAIRINPNFGGAYYNLGNLFGELKNHEQSIRYYDKAVILNFELKSTLVNRALQKIKINNLSSACVDLKRAYRLGRKDIKPLMDKYCK